eukprot:TRINITY_DN3939_c0_g1_i1.p1 TRINITY_DN3939_c0_g1~~TRINITY_DN3939_c0_g1_i1.p1  ORF type:complete len:298 (-),score=54.68 TRINITY_DN3939_c0_g1_i1:159-1052(-)
MRPRLSEKLFFLMGAGEKGQADNYGVLIDDLLFNLDQWNHALLAVVYTPGQAAPRIDLYVNGEKRTATFRIDAGSRQNVGVLYLGYYKNQNEVFFFNGKLDEIKIWEGDQSKSPYHRSVLTGKEPILPFLYFNFETYDQFKGRVFAEFASGVYFLLTSKLKRIESDLLVEVAFGAPRNKPFHLLELPGTTTNSTTNTGRAIVFYIQSIPPESEASLYVSPEPDGLIQPRTFPYILPSNLVFFKQNFASLDQTSFSYFVNINGKKSKDVNVVVKILESESLCEECLLCDVFPPRRVIN